MRGGWFVVLTVILLGAWLGACDEEPRRRKFVRGPPDEPVPSFEHKKAFLALGEKAVPCRSAADCCVVYDDCHAAVIVVGAGAFETARVAAAKADAEGWCHKCEKQLLDPFCYKGRCVGREVGFGEVANETTGRDHCGATITLKAARADGAGRTDGRAE